MTKKLFLSNIVFLLCYILSAQQVSTSNAMSLDDLIQNTLGKGCVEISNISSSINGSVDDIPSYGSFSKENSDFPFQNGLVLTTGNVKSAGNQLNTNPLNEGTTSWGKDSDLEMALGVSGTLNATSIEFDLISASNELSFNYLLASEEYFGTNPCQITDRFAFLIREVGSADPYTNIALIPGTSLPVNTTNIRPKIEGFCAAENPLYFQGYNVVDTNYNGRTTVLTASSIIKPNVAYHIKIVIADQNDPGLDSAIFIDANSFTATMDLGPDINTCTSSTTLNTTIANATYKWFRDNILITNAKNSSLNVTQSGIYKVQATRPVGKSFCTIEDEINITLNVQETLANIPNYILCEDPSTIGQQLYDLTIITAVVKERLPITNAYDITYYLTSAEAAGGVNQITSIRNINNSQDIFIRINNLTTSCVYLSGVKLIVNRSPLITKPEPLRLCDSDGIQDGITRIDLRQVDSHIARNYTETSNLSVTYHRNAVDVDSGDNAITFPYTNTSSNQTIYVRLLDSPTGCFSTTTLDLIVSNSPILLIDRPYINACNQNGDNFATFDLTSELNRVLNGLTGITSSIHVSYVDAEENKNAITNPSSYQNISPKFQEVYIRVMDNQTDCLTIVPLELHTNMAVTGLNLNDFNGCDLSRNGIVEFDLNAVESQLLNNYDGFDVIFFENINEQQNGVNSLDKADPYLVNSGPVTIYAYVTSNNCADFIPVRLIINPPVVLRASYSVESCDRNQDGYTDVFLPNFDSVVSEGVAAPQVKYYNTQKDALEDKNALDSRIYVNRQRTIYMRVTNTQTSCYDTASLKINILDAPIITVKSTSLFKCDADSKGYTFFNLEDSLVALNLDPNEYFITFHTNYNLAVAGTNPIQNRSNFNSRSQYIAVRVEKEKGCFSIVALYLVANTAPIIPTILNFQNCTTNGSSISDFYFNIKDEEILNGQTDKAVLYFETAQDAIDRTNIIDKFSASRNNPYESQTIYVRMEAANDPTCYATSSFVLEVDNSPSFNQAVDVFICEDLGDEGFATFDLSVKESEIRRNTSDKITFYNDKKDADREENGITDLKNFRTKFNPQTIYVRVDNGTFCYSLTSFSINEVSLPKVEAPSDLYYCNSDSSSPIVFDLEVVKILDFRPDNIVITFHESMIGVINDTETIHNSKNYITTSDQRIVYAKIRNTLPQESCYISIPINLNIVFPPTINDFKEYQICPTQNNYFDLKTIDSELTSEPNIQISYFKSRNDAIANDSNSVLNLEYTYRSSNDRISARLQNALTQCVSYYDFELIVNSLPVANKPKDLEFCDGDFDGRLTFNLSLQNEGVLGTQSDLNHLITYHQTLQAALEGTPLLDDLYNATDGQVIFARIVNTDTGCFSTTEFSVIVNPKPNINIPDQVICSNTTTSTIVVSAKTDNERDTYLWSTGATTSEIEIGYTGSYWVTVTGDFNCETTSEFEVLAYESATIEVVETIDFSDPNNIKITVSGRGDYLYTLDDGLPQESNVFNNVSLGYHIITVIDAVGCTETSKEVVVIDTPKFMTPNDDGYFDTWHITGVETLPGTVIYIYDRYGKQLAYLTATSNGWDGNYNGQKMPSSDYWFVADVKKDGVSFQLKGHFALKR